jgi:hypothetical protein
MLHALDLHSRRILAHCIVFSLSLSYSNSNITATNYRALFPCGFAFLSSGLVDTILHACASKVRDANCPNGCLSLSSSSSSTLFVHSFMVGLKRPTIAISLFLHSNNYILANEIIILGLRCAIVRKMMNSNYTSIYGQHTYIYIHVSIYIYGHIFSHRYQICTF